MDNSTITLTRTSTHKRLTAVIWKWVCFVLFPVLVVFALHALIEGEYAWTLFFAFFSYKVFVDYRVWRKALKGG